MNFVIKTVFVFAILAAIGGAVVYGMYYVKHSPIAAPVRPSDVKPVVEMLQQVLEPARVPNHAPMRLEELEKNLAKERQQLDKILAQTRLAQGEVDALDKTIVKCNKKIKSINGFIDSAKTRVHNAKAEVAGATGRVNQLQGRGGQFNSTYNRAVQDLERAKGHLIEAEAYYGEKTGLLEAAQIELKTYQKERQSLVSGGQASLQALNTKSDELADRIADMEDKIDEILEKESK